MSEWAHRGHGLLQTFKNSLYANAAVQEAKKAAQRIAAVA
jgi:hypothetical protein